MNPDEFKKALEGLENGNDLLSYHNSMVEAERTKGKEITHKNNQENQKLRKYKTYLEKMGYEDDMPLEKLKEAISSNIEANDKIQELTSQVEGLTSQLQESQDRLNAEMEQRQRIEKDSINSTIRSLLYPKLDKFNGADLLIDSLFANDNLGLDEKRNLVFKVDGKSKDVDEGLKWLSDKHADLLKNMQKGGSGSNPGGTAGKPKYTMEQIKAMTPEQAAADMAEVNASLAAISNSS